jgi:2,3,4,5-tetrahydropyridine-2-carboxylate N-succinyltransferase
MEKLQKLIEELETNFEKEKFKSFVPRFLEKLNNGEIRSASPLPNGGWQVNVWVKKGILLLFKYGQLVDMSINSNFKFFDKDTLPLKQVSLENKIRIVPGGSAIRSGCFIAPGVICMPPMYVNIGAYVDEGTLLDSHSLVGSCAQIGKRVHLSAGSQIGGVLEPIGAFPVIVEDDVFIGGNCGIYEGVRIHKGAVIASGVVLTSSTKVFDVVNQKLLYAEEGKPLEIPEFAVVVAGTRKLTGEFPEKYGLSIYTPIIIKYRDERTDSKSALETTLRQ